MFLLREHFDQLEVLTEQTDKGKVLYLEGPMLQATIKNRNQRIYPKDVMEKAVDSYVREYINERRAIGELNHPNRPFADPKLAAMMVESLTWQGDLVIGRARILDTPDGQIIRALTEAGFKGGVSSRGLGNVVERSGNKVVNEYMLNAIDYVDMPSGQSCYPSAIFESASQWINKNGIWLEENYYDKEKAQELFMEKFKELLESVSKRSR